MKFLSVFLIFLLTMNGAFAAKELNKEFTKTLSKYSTAQNVEVGLKKTDEKAALGTKSVSEGVLKFAKDKIYIMLNGEKKIEFFYKKNTVWLIEYPDLDFDKDGKRKVAVLKKSTPVLMSGLINLFSNQKKFLKEFKVISEKQDGNTLTIEFLPKQKNLKSFTLIIDKKDRLIKQVIFTDDIDTKTTLDLSNLKMNKKMSSSEFDYKKLKSDEVTYE
jgi:outer membrane lipoprotein-sorting protein